MQNGRPIKRRGMLPNTDGIGDFVDSVEFVEWG